MKKIAAVFSVLPQLILHGPPGTGKTHEARELAAQLLGFDSVNEDFRKAQFRSTDAPSGKGRWEIVQFHPSYNYEDFVRSIESKAENGTVIYRAVNKVFAEMCVEADKSGHPYVLIVDEINRANLAAVFGELLYALEYRGEPVRTSYEVEGQRTLRVPKNLYVIGTMNTAASLYWAFGLCGPAPFRLSRVQSEIRADS
jgi:5-methylcytosine-specific restriction protein B